MYLIKALLVYHLHFKWADSSFSVFNFFFFSYLSIHSGEMYKFYNEKSIEIPSTLFQVSAVLH